MMQESPPKNQADEEDVVEYEEVCVHIPEQAKAPKPADKVKKIDMRTTEDKIVEEM